jgi:hypothetical protein
MKAWPTRPSTFPTLDPNEFKGHFAFNSRRPLAAEARRPMPPIVQLLIELFGGARSKEGLAHQAAKFVAAVHRQLHHL